MRLFVFLCMMTVAYAQPLEIVRADKGWRPTNRMLFVVDTSGSMSGSMEEAFSGVNLILGTDEMYAGLITFTATARRWEVPWAKLPWDYEKFDKVLKSSIPLGLTNIVRPIKLAMKERRKGVTIVLVTDGEFNHKRAIATIKEMREWRKKQKLDPIKILIWGVGPKGKELADVAKVGGGGLWIHSKKRNGPW